SEAQVERLLAESKKDKLALDDAAARLHLIAVPIEIPAVQKPEPIPATPATVEPQDSQKPGVPAADTAQADLIAYIREVFSEITQEQAAEVAELTADHGQSRKIARAACLLVLSSWEPVKAVEGAELAARDTQARQIMGMLDLCLELEEQ